MLYRVLKLYNKKRRLERSAFSALFNNSSCRQLSSLLNNVARCRSIFGCCYNYSRQQPQHCYSRAAIPPTAAPAAAPAPAPAAPPAAPPDAPPAPPALSPPLADELDSGQLTVMQLRLISLHQLIVSSLFCPLQKYTLIFHKFLHLTTNKFFFIFGIYKF